MYDFVQSKKSVVRVCISKMEGPRPDKFAFAKRSAAMKAPVGLLSDRTVLREQDGGAPPRQVRVCAKLEHMVDGRRPVKS